MSIMGKKLRNKESRLERIKDAYAKEIGFNDFNEMYLTFGVTINHNHINEISHRYAKECVIASLERASYNYVLEVTEVGIAMEDSLQESITSQENIILL